MRRKITIDPLNPQSIQKAIRELEDYKKEIKYKADALCDRLATLGATQVSISYARVGTLVSDYGGMPEIEVENEGDTWKILANGEEAIFIEFGSGDRYGWGHPEPLDYGPGTYNPEYPTKEKPNWSNPKGWYTPLGQHTYGNEPTAGMYWAKVEMKENLKRIAREVFNG